MDTAKDLQVVAGLLFDPQGQVLVAARPVGKAFAGRWEFPGGKIDPGENAVDALVRELNEELGIEANPSDCEFFHAVTHRYPGASRSVRIQAYRVRTYQGTPRGRENQAIAWHPPEELPEVDVLEADRPIVTALRLGALINVSQQQTDRSFVRDCRESHPPGQGRHIVGVCVGDESELAIACASGADFLLLTRPITPSFETALLACGLPWYADAQQPHPKANGCWCETY